MRKLMAMAVACVMLCGMAAAEELVESPLYQSWAKVQPGTVVVWNQETVMGPQMKMSAEMTQKLLEVTPEAATVQMTSTIPGAQNTPQSMVHPARVAKELVDTQGKLPEGFQGEVKDLGTEKLTIAGKEYECKVSQFTAEQEGGMKMKGKTWGSPEIPGMMARMEMSSDGGEMPFSMTMSIKSIETK